VRPDTEVAAFLAGFVAAEGCFTLVAKPRFTFVVALGATDASTCEMFRALLGIGAVRRYPRRREHYDDEVTFAVQRTADLVNVVVPFMDDHLPESHKREQYLAWRAALLDHWERRAKRVRPCTVDGCDEPRRAHGFCRRHLYERRGV
jgi:hypothetical protein